MDYQQSWQGASSGAQSRVDFVRLTAPPVASTTSPYNILISLMNLLGGRRR